MRPLDRVSSIKVKLGVVILAAVAVTVMVVTIGVRAEVPLALLAAGAAVLALGMVQLLAHGMTFPLREMVAAAREMARGDYSRRVTATSRDEVGELARAFNTMAGELAEVDRMRRDLVANVSHELRTPIGALQAVLENLVDGVERPDPDTLRTMLRQVQRLARLVTQLLDLSRLESGAVPLHRRTFELRPLLEEAVAESRLQSEALQFEVRVDPSGLEVIGDPERVHQVLANLLENAVRYSPAGGIIRLSARPEGRFVRLDVEDQGPGIPEAEATRIFERFYRADDARSAGGAGLGLSIARWIVDLHEGDIRAETNGSAGCTIVVHLPRPPA